MMYLPGTFRQSDWSMGVLTAHSTAQVSTIEYGRLTLCVLHRPGGLVVPTLE